MCDTYDNRLFNNITRNLHNILHQLLPSVSAAAENYNLRARKHNRLLPQCTACLCGSMPSVTLILFIKLFILTFINILQNCVVILLC